MPTFDKDDYLNGMSDAESLKGDPASAGSDAKGGEPKEGTGKAEPHRDGRTAAQPGADDAQGQKKEPQGKEPETQDGDRGTAQAGQDGQGDDLTPLGRAKKEAADYLEALQRERAQFVNYRNRTLKEQETFRQHGVTDVLTSLLPALDDIDRIREHGGLDDSFQAVASKIDKTFEKFGVVKFGEKGEDFDPTRHEAILHKPDPEAKTETVDTVVEAGYMIGDRVIRAARVVVASPQGK
ncbi:nucleotide exchange factor GrpE [Bifidobacterium xylocopae]|uniref:Protein GrpE n=1 Tax=Bifidobacterium xylocopae TaxID=2493119 RepID=A0A366KB80_9BIFI|nr:nucleotide exchange factor GrpE [Bifidobacterium xylocopae]RBP98944.1 nucleotide exchange factor GrpE [Bifidobacterium xylocopae]